MSEDHYVKCAVFNKEECDCKDRQLTVAAISASALNGLLRRVEELERRLDANGVYE